MADKQTTIPFYDQYPNRGFGELGYNIEDLVGSANFTNQSILPNNGLLSMTGGGSYQPLADNTVNPRVAINYQDPSGLNIKALIDEYRKTAGAEYGPAYANITDTGNDVIKQLGFQGQNFGANITNSNQGTGYNAGYSNQLTDDSKVNFDFSKSPDGSYMGQLMYELGF